jgi:phosphoenolpyruvate carboxykinase (ATP)
MSSVAKLPGLDLTSERVHRNLSTPVLIEAALQRNEGKLAANGTLVVMTGERTGRSPKDKYLEDTPDIHDNIWWGNVNQPITPDGFDSLLAVANEYLGSREELFVFDGFVGADPKYRLASRTITELAWHSLFVKTLFIEPAEDEVAGFEEALADGWTILNCAKRKLTPAEAEAAGVAPTGTCIIQSLTRKMVIIFGTEYAGEMKKSLFYAMNYDMPDVEVFPMHCSANVAKHEPNNVALFFGLSGTGKTTLSADEKRALIGDDEHGWSADGVFNFEGGCYAKCINLSAKTEPQIWDAIRFGSCLENVVMDPDTRVPDYDSVEITQNTRVTYPVEFIPGAQIPSVGRHPKNVIFLTADAFGVLPAVSKLTPEQAMYYFINGYTSKLAGTEQGVTEPTPNFSPCFGGPFLPRHPAKYAQQLAERIKQHNAHVWLVNTGWRGTNEGTLRRYSLPYTRAMVTGILDGSLAKAQFVEHPIFGLQMPKTIPGAGIPDDILNPRSNWTDKNAYDEAATKLAKLFRENDKKFEMSDSVRAAGPKA